MRGLACLFKGLTCLFKGLKEVVCTAGLPKLKAGDPNGGNVAGLDNAGLLWREFGVFPFEIVLFCFKTFGDDLFCSLPETLKGIKSILNRFSTKFICVFKFWIKNQNRKFNIITGSAGAS